MQNLFWKLIEYGAMLIKYLKAVKEVKIILHLDQVKH